MDMESYESKELDAQEQLAREYALSEHQRYGAGNGRPPKKKGPGFGLGILIGSASTLLVVTVALLFGWYVMRSVESLADSVPKIPEKETEAKGTRGAVVDDAVAKKAGELAELIDPYY